MMTQSYRFRTLPWLLGLSLTAALAGAAVAADSPLDQANASVAKAISLLQATAHPSKDAAFESHKKKAIMLLTRAQGEIVKAQQRRAGTKPDPKIAD